VEVVVSLWRHGSEEVERPCHLPYPEYGENPKITTTIATSARSTLSCTEKVKGRTALDYPSMPSSIAPVLHSEEYPVPCPPKQVNITLFPIALN